MPPPTPRVDKKQKLKKKNTLKEMVLNKGKTLTAEDIASLNPLETKKYKTRTMLDEILGARDVKRSTMSPWQMMSKQSEVKAILRNQPKVSPKREASKSSTSSLEEQPVDTFLTKIGDEAEESSEFEDEHITYDYEQDPYKVRSEGFRAEPSMQVDPGFIDIARLGPGASIGELALLDGKPRICTTKTITRCHFLILNKQQL